MKIYLSVPSQQLQSGIRILVPTIEKYGEIVNLNSLKNKSASGIHKRNVMLLEQVDAMVAEVTQPSLQTGYELGLAAQLDLPNIVLYSKEIHLPAMILGSSKLNCCSYSNLDGAVDLVKQYLNQFRRS